MKTPTLLNAAAVVLAIDASSNACPTNAHGTSQRHTTFYFRNSSGTPRAILTQEFTTLDRTSDGLLRCGISVAPVEDRGSRRTVDREHRVTRIAPGANPIIGLSLDDPWQITLDTSIPFDLSQLTLVSDQGDIVPLTGMIFVAHNTEYTVVRTSIRDLNVGSRIDDVSIEWCWAELPLDFRPAALRFTPSPS